jgi:hypothetical protein
MLEEGEKFFNFDNLRKVIESSLLKMVMYLKKLFQQDYIY